MPTFPTECICWMQLLLILALFIIALALTLIGLLSDDPNINLVGIKQTAVCFWPLFIFFTIVTYRTPSTYNYIRDALQTSWTCIQREVTYDRVMFVVKGTMVILGAVGVSFLLFPDHNE